VGVCTSAREKWLFWKAALGLCGLMIFGVLCARGIGAALPGALPPGFERCDLPCFAGIDLDHDNLADARRKLETLTGLRGSETEAGSGVWVYGTQTYQVYLRSVNVRPAWLGIDSVQEPALIRLGSVIALLGPPTEIHLRSYAGMNRFDLLIMYRLPAQGIDLLFRGGSNVFPQLHADSVQVYRLDTPDGKIHFSEAGARWQGFSLRRLAEVQPIVR
jgi:hypothetical protein